MTPARSRSRTKYVQHADGIIESFDLDVEEQAQRFKELPKTSRELNEDPRVAELQSLEAAIEQHQARAAELRKELGA